MVGNGRAHPEKALHRGQPPGGKADAHKAHAKEPARPAHAVEAVSAKRQEAPKTGRGPEAAKPAKVQPGEKMLMGENMRLRPFMRMGSALPRGVVAYFQQSMNYAGIRGDARIWLGMNLLFSFLLGSLMFFIYFIIFALPSTPENIAMGLLWWLGGMAIVSFLFYLDLYFRIADRAIEMEKVLPDFLLLTVSNLRAGMTPFMSFANAARPEFGALHDEVLLSASKASGTASLEVALTELGSYFDSHLFRRTTVLFMKGVKSGGKLANLLRATADDVQHIQDLRKELTTATRTYTLFLGFVVVLIMPFLLSIATLFVEIFIKLDPGYEAGSTAAMGNIPMFSGKILITVEEMRMVSIATLIITSMMVSLLSGVITRGKALYGLRYFPIFAIASAVFFLLAYSVVGDMLMSFGA